jgi:multidrug efflux pump subunit AcrA (membrane-fusion protein)
MKFSRSFIYLAACLLAGCTAFSRSTPEPLPTIVLDSNPSTPQASAGVSRTGIAASGVVVPAQQAQIAFPSGGNVQTVNVAVGDKVEAGQVLVKLAGSEEIVAALEAANLEQLSAQVALDQLNENLPDAQTEALQAVTAARDEVRDAERQLNSLNTPAEDIDVESAWATVVLAGDKLEKARKDFAPYENKSDENVIRAALFNKLAAAQNVYDDALRRYNNLKGISGSDFDRSQAEAKLQIAQSRLELAEQKYAELQDGPDPSEVSLADKRIKQAQAQIDAGQAALANLELRAPFAGTVAEMDIHSGEWVLPGQTILVLADLDNLRVDTSDLSERDIPQVEIGQPVTVYIEALNQEVSGRVSEIAPLADTLGGDVIYKATLDLNTNPPGLRPGMSVEIRFDANQ